MQYTHDRNVSADFSSAITLRYQTTQQKRNNIISILLRRLTIGRYCPDPKGSMEKIGGVPL